MAEIAPAGGSGTNRTFLLIVGGLAALLVLGLLAIGALFLLPSLLGPKQPIAAATLAPTRVAIAPTSTIVKATAVPTTAPATPTLVMVAAAAPTNTSAPNSNATATSGGASAGGSSGTPVAAAGGASDAAGGDAANGTLPQGGLGEDLLMLAVGLVLVAVLFGARRARVTG